MRRQKAAVSRSRRREVRENSISTLYAEGVSNTPREGMRVSRAPQNSLVQEALGRIARDAGLTPALEARLIEIAAGLTYREIARRNRISVNTVKTEVRALLHALRAHCRHEIEDAAATAQARADDGATPDELYHFLLLRFE